MAGATPPTIKLQDFVAEALTEIFEGVRRAQGALYHEDGKSDEANIGKGTADGPYLVAFEVLVVAESGASKKGTLGVVLGNIGVGGQASTNAASHQAHRLSFSVPVTFPNQQSTNARRKRSPEG